MAAQLVASRAVLSSTELVNILKLLVKISACSLNCDHELEGNKTVFMREENYSEMIISQNLVFWALIKKYLFQRLSRPEVLENIMMATPGLSEDPVAVSIIQDPDLLVHMENADTVRR
jgi:hypothetical protein